jgi:hypothetical protein
VCKTPSNVVLPELVPPESITFAAPRTQAARNLSARGPSAPLARSSCGVKGTGENLRMFSVGPQSERGGMIACTRLPSDSRASAKGDDSSTRRPSGPRSSRSRARRPPLSRDRPPKPVAASAGSAEGRKGRSRPNGSRRHVKNSRCPRRRIWPSQSRMSSGRRRRPSSRRGPPAMPSSRSHRRPR